MKFAPQDDGPKTEPRYRLPLVGSLACHLGAIAFLLGSRLSDLPQPPKEAVFVVDLMEDIPARNGGAASGGTAQAPEAIPPDPVRPPEPPPVVEPPPKTPAKVAKPKLQDAPKPSSRLSTAKAQPPAAESAPIGAASSGNPNSPSSTPASQGSASPGTDDKATIEAARTEYSALLLKVLNQHKEYPGLARKRGIEGTVVLRIVLSRDGLLQSFDVATSSGSDLLDDSAKAMVSNSSPYPPFPDSIQGPRATFIVPVTFKLS